jgi:hypothetical protein
VMLSGATLSFALATALTLAQAAPLPGDARLDPVRARLEAVVSGAAQDGLPAEVLVSKVREGLAKGVPADRIETATIRLAEGLKSAQAFVRERLPGTRRRSSWCARSRRPGWRASSSAPSSPWCAAAAAAPRPRAPWRC